MTAFLQSSTELLSIYLEGLREALNADAASIFLPALGESGTLMHRGDADPAPELRDEVAAALLALRVAGSKDPIGKALQSESPLCALIGLPSSPYRLAGRTPNVSSRRRASDPVQEPPAGVLGVRFSTPEARDAIFDNDENARAPAAECARRITVLAAELLQQATLISRTLEDPISGLPGRSLFQVQLSRHVERAWRESRPTSLLLVSPDGFGAVNEQFGRPTGDLVIGEIATRLRCVLRADDVIAKYGGAIFTLLLSESNPGAARTVGTKLCRTLGELPFLDGAITLSFSVGAATLEPAPDEKPEPEILLRRADRALGAARHGGGRQLEEWTPELEGREGQTADPLSDIFTGNMAKDYRNMTLLSEAMSAVAAARDVEELITQLAKRLLELLKGEHIAVCTSAESGDTEVMHALRRERRGDTETELVEQETLGRDAMALVSEAMRSESVVDAGVVEGTMAGGAQVHSYAVPLIARGRTLGCLYLDGRADRLAVDAADIGFLQALGSQLAIAFDRAQLAEQQFAWQEAESQRLRVQLDELREAVQQTKLVYRSEKMKSLLETARRVAPTDATVLVTGASGTGKELVARAVHRLSDRRDKPCVIVDCASVPSTLIESELFGHERGAYTGAEQRKIGRLVEADGGTLILDEIGELPLEVQAKFLRFVQEKEVIPVGGSRVRKVDARVVAATNRDLAREAEEGRFRADLYYRLNVVHLKVPPLSERPDDVLYLARHFLQKFSVQYQKGILRRLSAGSERALVEHTWPGNVRELQNRILQAVILSEGLEITLDVLGLDMPFGDGSGAEARETSPAERQSAATNPTFDRTSVVPVEDLATWDSLRDALSEAIELALESGNDTPPPLGTWLAHGLVLEANKESREVMRQAAGRIGMPEATFRRRLKKARASNNSGESPPPHWERIRALLASLISAAEDSGEDLGKRARDLLLEGVCEKVPLDVATGSALMGVTEPTFRRWTQELS